MRSLSRNLRIILNFFILLFNHLFFPFFFYAIYSSSSSSIKCTTHFVHAIRTVARSPSSSSYSSSEQNFFLSSLVCIRTHITYVYTIEVRARVCERFVLFQSGQIIRIICVRSSGYKGEGGMHTHIRVGEEMEGENHSNTR